MEWLKKHKTWLTLILGLLVGGGLLWLFGAQDMPALTGSFVGISDIGAAGKELSLPGDQQPQHPGGVSSSTPSPNAISSGLLPVVLALRQAHRKGDVVASAQKVTELETLVKASGSDALHDSWEALALCIAHNCPDDNFLEFVRAVSLEDARANRAPGQLVINLLTARKYWGTDNTVRFSEAVSDVDAAVRSRSGLADDWKAIVSCGASCANEPSRYFTFLEHLFKP